MWGKMRQAQNKSSKIYLDDKVKVKRLNNDTKNINWCQGYE